MIPLWPPPRGRGRRRRRVRWTCTACGERGSAAAPEPGEEVGSLGIPHEHWCPFLAAVERGRAEALKWIRANGYPIRVEVAA